MTTHIVYKIYDEQGMTYIGSTSMKISQRKAKHKEDFKHFSERKLYKLEFYRVGEYEN